MSQTVLIRHVGRDEVILGDATRCCAQEGTLAMTADLLVDTDLLREQVREKYRDVAVEPHRAFHFHTGRPLAARLDYEPNAVDALPDRAVESCAGVGNPFSLRRLQPGERVSSMSVQVPGSIRSSPHHRSGQPGR